MAELEKLAQLKAKFRQLTELLNADRRRRCCAGNGALLAFRRSRRICLCRLGFVIGKACAWIWHCVHRYIVTRYCRVTIYLVRWSAPALNRLLGLPEWRARLPHPKRVPAVAVAPGRAL